LRKTAVVLYPQKQEKNMKKIASLVVVTMVGLASAGDIEKAAVSADLAGLDASAALTVVVPVPVPEKAASSQNRIDTVKMAAQDKTAPALQCDGARLENICWQTVTPPLPSDAYPYTPTTVQTCRRQLFVFGAEQRNFFLSSGMMKYPNARGEVILPEVTAIPNSPDAMDKSGAYTNDGRVFYLKLSGNSLTVESFRTTQPTGGMYLQLGKVADYVFNNCR